MTLRPKRHWDQPPSLAVSIVLFLALTGFMAYLRLHLFPDRFVALTYGLPLLICLWHRDRRLLWGMVVAFIAMASLKAFLVLPATDPDAEMVTLHWIFQVVNILVIGGTIHAILNLTDALRAKNAALEEANDELQAQAEELAQQNEEIQQQSEEIQQQSEELQQQNEELGQQNEELHQQGEELAAQAEELQTVNAELNERELMLQALLRTAGLDGDEQRVLQEICAMVLSLIGPGIQCAAVLEKREDELVVRAQAGLPGLENGLWLHGPSLASIAIEHGRTACVHDLAERPDLVAPRAPELAMRASMATPIRVEGQTVGAIEVHSVQPLAWTTRQFQLLEWASTQSALIIQIHRLRSGLEKLVGERTARLQELVDELEHFSYSITHDLRAPLRAMQGFAGILVKECTELKDNHAQYLGHIMESASRMDRLIIDALNFTKAVRADLRLSRVDTQRLVEGIVKSYPNLQSPHATVEIANHLSSVVANEAGLTQCVSNLLDNAVKFVAPGTHPHVTIGAEAEDGHIRLWIKDNGIGISPDFQPYLFQMFRRASREYSGTGIGLALVKKTCERMGGKVGVCSEPGRGSQFWIMLKAATETSNKVGQA